jgi:ABC-type Na+ transport system ATPase subunit NatA
VLYPQLTVLEHLFFFGNIKGLYGQRLRTSIEDVIAKVGLTEAARPVLSAWVWYKGPTVLPVQLERRTIS